MLDTLMADLVGHDHRPSSFLVYLAITGAHADGRASFSHAELAERTGQSRRTVQNAVEALNRGG
ncbi:helix-turn-helix domain-containing protein [Caulobacter segnis]